MELPTSVSEATTHALTRNLDYVLRVKNAKTVLVASDFAGEGKSTFIADVAPVLASVYRKKVLVCVCGGKGDEPSYVPAGSGVDFARENDPSAVRRLGEGYDVVLVEWKNGKRDGGSGIAAVNADGVVLVRSGKSVGTKAEKKVTQEVQEEELPVLGLVNNGGLK